MLRKTKPFFSVVITTYNRAELLTRALKSLIAQTERDWEAIIMDDGSTDDTFRHVGSLLKKNANIKYTLRPHQGMVEAKNAGIRLSSGKFVTFLDSDDEFHPVHLATRKELVEKNPDIRFFYGRVTVLGNQYVPDRFDQNRLIHLNECVIGGSVFIDRDTVNSLKGFRNISLATDADLLDRAKIAGVPIKEVPSFTYIYHHENEDSITNRLFTRVH